MLVSQSARLSIGWSTMLLLNDAAVDKTSLYDNAVYKKCFYHDGNLQEPTFLNNADSKTNFNRIMARKNLWNGS